MMADRLVAPEWEPQAGIEGGTRETMRQFLQVALLVGAVWVLAAAHLAAVARPLFVIGALTLAYRNIRRSPWHYLTFSLWIWTLAPFVRRVVDYYGGFQPGSIILIAPNLLALMMLKSVLSSPGLLKRREAAAGALLLVPVLCGLAVSFFKGDIYPGLVGAIDWVIPLIYYFYLIEFIPRIDEAEAHLMGFIPLNLGIVAFYGIYQTFYPTPWDLDWIRNVKMFTMAGTGGGVFSLKPFSTLNAPGICAAWVAFGLMMSLHFRNRLSLIVLPAAVFFLLLTEVRADLGAVVFGFAVALLFGHRKIIQSLALFAVVMVVVLGTLAVANPHLADILSQRFGSVGSLGQDQSAQARTELYRQLPDMLDRYPLGMGIGGIGRGAIAGSGGDSNADFVSVDGGPIAIYLALGWVAGTIYFAGIIGLVGMSLWAARTSRSLPALAAAIAAMGGGTTLAFTNLVGLQGLLVWLPAAYAIAIGANARMASGALLNKTGQPRHASNPARLEMAAR